MKIRDQIGHEVKLLSSGSPRRIISLVPSQSELLVDLGCEKQLVGITRFCTHPKHLRSSIKKVGGTKDLDFKAIEIIKPDLIICNKEENNKEDVLKLQKLFPTYTSDVNTIDQALKMISDIGEITQTKTRGIELIDTIKSDFKKLENKFSGTVVYLIWDEPIMLAGRSTFISSMLNTMGFTNFIKDESSRYPKVSEKDLESKNIDFIFLSSEPYPFKEKNKITFQNKFPKARVVLVDGRMFSWYGSCLARVFDYANTLSKQLY